MTSSLGLAGDLDDVELIEDVEAAFGIRLVDEEISRCSTVGQLFELIEARLPEMPSGQSCATAMCFYRLRRALQPHSAIALKPKTSIMALRAVPVRKLHRIIEAECGLRPPPQYITLWGCLALLFVAVFPFGLFAIGMPWWVALPSAAFGVGFYWFAPIRLPDEAETFGDLVRIVASRSIGALADQGARIGPKEAWKAFTDVLSDHTQLLKTEIWPETLLLAPKKATA
ncbi:acyl carrier protein (plasmid) [Sphingobium sp. V4]|uniref:acyl carrier protein n=1 Tax=Sphingobium sp. V4 TaxID=3038927 RepID=UPI002557F84C|nr:acyl carrier protein [Sphingobium sp. V4]WIW90491.1 acyl carrier protein [Sphingobium sp. V4]